MPSKDFGSTWQPLTLLTAPGEVSIQGLAIDQKNSSTIFYTAPAAFYVSVDAGSTWKTHKLPTARLPAALAIDPATSGVLYIGVAVPEKK